MIVTLADIKDVIKNEGLSPDELYGKEFMRTWRQDENEIDRLYRKVDQDRAREKQGLVAVPAEAEPEKKAETEKELSPFLDPKRNPFIKLD